MGLAALAATAVPVTAHAGSADADPHFFWRWTDRADASTRTFTRDSYVLQSRLPRLVVTAEPSTSAHRVALQYLDGGRWHDEDVSWTRPTGQAVLELNPYCPDGHWCDRVFAYRLVAAGRTTAFTIRYVA